MWFYLFVNHQLLLVSLVGIFIMCVFYYYRNVKKNLPVDLSIGDGEPFVIECNAIYYLYYLSKQNWGKISRIDNFIDWMASNWMEWHWTEWMMIYDWIELMI